jgi:hypothetical protein
MAAKNPGFTFTQYIHQKTGCISYRSAVINYAGLKAAGIRREEAMRQARQQSARSAIGTDPMSALDSERVLLDLVDLIYQQTFIDTNALAARAYQNCMTGKPLS